MTITWEPLPPKPPFGSEMIMELSGGFNPIDPVRHFHDHDVLTSADEISDRIASVTARGPWTGSEQAKRAYGLLLAIRSVLLVNLAQNGDAAVSLAQQRNLLADPQFGTQAEQQDALGSLIQDGITSKRSDGGLVILAAPSGRDADPFPGWEGPDPKRARLPHMPTGWQSATMRDLHARILAQGLPGGLHLAADARKHLAEALHRGRVALPAWAWAWLLNQKIPHERHPVSPRTAARRLADLETSGDLVKTRRAVHKFDPQAWAFRTRAAEYAPPSPGLAGVAHRIRRAVRRRRASPDDALPPPTSAWRLQQARWEWRDAERRHALWAAA